jgi:hypothetical protein
MELEFQNTKYASRDTNLSPSTRVENVLQISPFLTNKPNFSQLQDPAKPKQSQTNPISSKAKNERKKCYNNEL